VETFADLSDFTSDTEAGEARSAASPVGAALTMYSVALLLRLRAAVCNEDYEPPVRYGTQAISELPVPATSPKKVRFSSSLSEESWWRAAPEPEESWWGPKVEQAPLPVSSAESWVVAQQRNRNPEEDERVTRAARSILNKLTVEKFTSLFEQLATCGIKQPHHISILMHEIFEKATSQHHFIPMYADLCVQLEKDPRIVSVVEEAGELHNFRRLLLNECQSVFEQLFESSTCDSKECNPDQESTFRRKQQALGNMKLIGQLLVHGMLSSDLFVSCCEELLRKRATCPEALESLVALMMVAGPKFDKSSWQHYRSLQNILSDMALLIKDKSTAPRLRFLIRDVLDARDAGWPFSRNGCKTAGIGPSKLEEVRADQASDAVQKVSPDVKKEWTALIKDVTDPQITTFAKNAPWKAKQQPTPTCQTGSCNAAEQVTPSSAPQEAFQAVEFRRALNGIFNDLASDKNIPAAVQRVRSQNVPAESQADQYVDILTRVVEERRGAVRRCELAFVAGLSANSAFERKECLAGLDFFFRNVYGGLCNEVHRLPAIMKSEFLPTMLTVFEAADINTVVPASMRK